MNTHSNLHAANATSIVGNAIPIPSRTSATSTSTSTLSSAAAAAAAAANASAAVSAAAANNAAVVTGLQNAAAAAAQMSLNQMRAAFKPVGQSGSVLASPMVMSTANSANPSGLSNAVMKMNQPMVPNTAGAGALNLSGRWYLDRQDSDSMNDYLEAMGLPLIARQAADKLDLMVVIHQTPGEFSITRRTRIFMETKVLKFGQEVNIKGNLIKLVGDATTIKTWTQLSLAGLRGLLTDIRTMDEKGRMCVELTLQLPDRPPVCTRRYFTKTSESTSLEDLPPFDISLETAGDVKRKR